MDTIDTRGFYENYVNAINNHDFDRMEAFYSRSIRFQLYDTVQNFDALIDGLSGINSAFPDWHWKVLEVLFDGKLITARYADTGTHMGLFQGIEPTGAEGAGPGVRRVSDRRRSDRRDVVVAGRQGCDPSTLVSSPHKARSGPTR
jgi:predicted ester cyclase